MARSKGSRSTRRSQASEGQARCWRVMHYLTENAQGFTTVTLAMAANVSLDTARHYLKALERSGHARKVRAGLSGRAGSFDFWRLDRYTGPDAPILHRNRTGIYDPNTQTHFDFGAPNEAAS